MKTKEELDEIKMEVENLGKKLNELTDEELNEVTGGGNGIDTKFGLTSGGASVVFCTGSL